MKPRSLHNSAKKGLYDFFYRDVTAFHEVPFTPLVFHHATSRKMLKHNHPLCVT